MISFAARVMRSPASTQMRKYLQKNQNSLLIPRFLIFYINVIPAAAFAHSSGVAGGALSGFAHPLFGPDHIAAMVAVGLWGAFLGPPAIFLLPVVFPLVM